MNECRELREAIHNMQSLHNYLYIKNFGIPFLTPAVPILPTPGD